MRLGAQGVRLERTLVVRERRLLAPVLLQQHRQVEVRLQVLGVELQRSLEAGAGLRPALLVVIDRAEVAVGVGELRIGDQGLLVGFDGVGVGGSFRIEATALLEPVLGLAARAGAALLIGRAPGALDRGHLGERLGLLAEVEHQLAVGLQQHPLVVHDHAAGAFVPYAQGTQRLVDIGQPAAERLHAAPDAPQRNALLEQRHYAPYGHEIAEAERGGVALGRSGPGRVEKPGALPVAQPLARHAADPRDVTQ